MARANRNGGRSGARSGPVQVMKGASPRLMEAARDELRARGVPVELERIRRVSPGVVELDLTPGPPKHTHHP